MKHVHGHPLIILENINTLYGFFLMQMIHLMV